MLGDSTKKRIKMTNIIKAETVVEVIRHINIVSTPTAPCWNMAKAMTAPLEVDDVGY
jgi:hypothetical protein